MRRIRVCRTPLLVLFTTKIVKRVWYRNSHWTGDCQSLSPSGTYSLTIHLSHDLISIWQDTFVRKAEHGLDLENRAYYMTVSIQRWLSVRLDFFGNILILGIALFALGFRTSVNPAKVGVVLSYTLGSKFGSISISFCICSHASIFQSHKYSVSPNGHV